jgi:hypothetical protein
VISRKFSLTSFLSLYSAHAPSQTVRPELYHAYLWTYLIPKPNPKLRQGKNPTADAEEDEDGERDEMDAEEEGTPGEFASPPMQLSEQDIAEDLSPNDIGKIKGFPNSVIGLSYRDARNCELAHL